MEENTLAICGIYDGGFYFVDLEEVERIHNDELLIYLFEITTCISSFVKKFFSKQINKKIIPKYLPAGSECIIMYIEIKLNDQYYQCELCDQVYLKDSLDKWFEQKKSQICPHCKSSSINTNLIYLNN
jgi:hypothetical protein